MEISARPIQQAASIPVHAGQVCLIQSSNGKRWVVPKGHIEAGMTAAETALQEAWEEAGLIGLLQPEPLGSYYYEKWNQIYHVTVFRMDVTEIMHEWPESDRRARHWLAPEVAVMCILEPGLRQLVWHALRSNRSELPAQL
jgi:8-oxo-dGTP pyrophosphatase MutT (NUDIX family)